MSKNVRVIVFLVLFLALLHTSASGQQKKDSNQWVHLLDQVKKSTVFLGRIDEGRGISLRATGFLVKIDNVYHLVTAKHVVMEQKRGRYTGKFIDEGMMVFLNGTDRKMALRSIDNVKKTLNVNWIFHDNENVDIAIIPFPLNPQKDDVKIIPSDLFLSAGKLFELYDVFFLSYQPGIEPKGKISPIIRNGIISLINDNNTFYIDGFAFPGNSGSPVFLKPSPIRFDRGGVFIGADELGGKFIGVVGAYIPYREVAVSEQTLRPRVVFEENTGLTVVWSANFINEIAASDRFKQQSEKLQKK